MSRVSALTGLVAVTLLAPCGPLNAGEVAGFPPDEAELLVNAKDATYELAEDVVDDDGVVIAGANAEARRLADEAEAQRRFDEAVAAQVKEFTDGFLADADAQRVANEADEKRRFDEAVAAEAKRLTDKALADADAKRVADEAAAAAEAKRVADAAKQTADKAAKPKG